MKFKEYLKNAYMLNEGINDKGIFKAIFMSGSPGSGKTYVLNKIRSGSIDAKIVNTDKFFEFFGNQPNFKDKSKYLNKKQLVLYLNSMLPLFIDGTSSDYPALIKRTGLIESIGYDTGMVFVKTNLETCLERNKKRHRQVPEDFLIRVYERVEGLKQHYKNKFKFFVEIENNVGELTDQVLKDAFKAVTGFYLESVRNPIGVINIQTMKDNGWKYLQDGLFSFKYLEKLVSVWYKNR